MYVCMQMPHQVNIVTFITQNQQKMKVDIFIIIKDLSNLKKMCILKRNIRKYHNEKYHCALTFIKLSRHNQRRGDHM